MIATIFLFCYVVVINESVVYLMYVVTVSGIFSSCYLFYPKKELMFFDVLKEYVIWYTFIILVNSTVFHNKQ